MPPLGWGSERGETLILQGAEALQSHRNPLLTPREEGSPDGGEMERFLIEGPRKRFPSSKVGGGRADKGETTLIRLLFYPIFLFWVWKIGKGLGRRGVPRTKNPRGKSQGGASRKTILGLFSVNPERKIFGGGNLFNHRRK